MRRQCGQRWNPEVLRESLGGLQFVQADFAVQRVGREVLPYAPQGREEGGGSRDLVWIIPGDLLDVFELRRLWDARYGVETIQFGVRYAKITRLLSDRVSAGNRIQERS